MSEYKSLQFDAMYNGSTRKTLYLSNDLNNKNRVIFMHSDRTGNMSNHSQYYISIEDAKNIVNFLNSVINDAETETD